MATKHKFVVFGTGPNAIQWRLIHYATSESNLTPTQSDMQAWVTALWNTCKSIITDAYTVYGIGYSPFEGTDPKDTRGWGATVVYPVSLAGESVGQDCLPGQAAWVLLGRTAVKRVIARKFLPCIREADQNAGVPVSSCKTVLGNAAGFLYASTYMMGGVGLTPCAWGKYHGFTPTITGTYSAYAGSQRRRKPGVGI